MSKHWDIEKKQPNAPIPSAKPSPSPSPLKRFVALAQKVLKNAS